MTGVRELRMVRAYVDIDTGRELLAELAALDIADVGPEYVGRLEAALKSALLRVEQLVDELAAEMQGECSQDCGCGLD